MTATITTRRTASAVLAEHGSTLLRFVDHVVLDVAVADRITGETVVAAARTSAATAVSYQPLATAAWERLRVDPDVARVLAAPVRTSSTPETSYAAAVAAALGSLPIIDRAIWHLSTRDRLDSADISAIVGRSKPFVLAHITRVTAAMPTAL